VLEGQISHGSYGRIARSRRAGAIDDHREELLELRRWLVIDRFDRRAANRLLAQLRGDPVGDLAS